MDLNQNFYKIKFAGEANDELDGIYNYICNQLKENKIAEKLRILIINKILDLEIMPYRYFKLGKDIQLKNVYHRMVIKNYVVLYTIDEFDKKVFISHIYYGRRNYLGKFLYR